MNGKQLKNSILQWAIQGKLVPQDPNDEPASVLLEKIRTEKARLIKEGKIKKDKKESIIYRGEDNSYYEKFADGKVVCIDEEIPFEIPQGWEWCRIKHIFTMQAGKNITAKRIHTTQSEKYKYPCFGGNGLRGYVTNYNTEGTFSLVGRQGALCGNVNIVSGKFYATEHAVVTDGYGLTDTIWMYFFLQALNLNQYATATAQPGLAVSNIIEVFIPLPPIAEQYRIVEKIQKLLPIIKQYSNAQIKLNILNKNIKIMMRKSVLQEAIQGKLVPQDPNDEPASVLLQRIKEEKLRLVKEGELKKKDIVDSIIYKGDDNKYYEQVGKSITEITEEIPFSIPDSWTWSRLSGVAKIIMGQSPDGNDVFETEKEDNAYEFHQGKIYFTEKYISPSGKWCKNPPRIANIGSLLVCVRAPIGDVNIVQRQIGIGRGLAAIIGYAKIKTDFLYYWILAHKKNLIEKGTGSTFKAITLDVLKDLIIPIPPLAEQKRISSRIELLYNKIEDN